MVSRKHRTDGLASAPNAIFEAQQSRTTSNPAEAMPVAGANSAGASTWKQQRRAFTVGFVAACAVAMFGWLTGLGWATISVVHWLFY
jgi:hypothetical protein